MPGLIRHQKILKVLDTSFHRYDDFADCRKNLKLSFKDDTIETGVFEVDIFGELLHKDIL